MKIFYCCARFLSIAFLAVTCARADVFNTMGELHANPRVVAYFKSPAMMAELTSLALDKERKFKLQPECSASEVTRVMINMLTPIDFPSEREYPVKGRWQAVFELDRCGQRRIHNEMFEASESAAPQGLYLSSGLSIADAQLMKDAGKSALLAVMLKEPEAATCKDIDLYRVSVTEPPAMPTKPDGRITTKWKENWTFWFCGKLYDIGMRFEPNATGTRFVVDSASPGRLP